MRPLSLSFVLLLLGGLGMLVFVFEGLPRIMMNEALNELDAMLADTESRGLWNIDYRSSADGSFTVQLSRKDNGLVVLQRSASGSRIVRMRVPAYTPGIFPAIVDGKCERQLEYEMPCDTLDPEQWQDLHRRALILADKIAGLS